MLMARLVPRSTNHAAGLSEPVLALDGPLREALQALKLIPVTSHPLRADCRHRDAGRLAILTVLSSVKAADFVFLQRKRSSRSRPNAQMPTTTASFAEGPQS